MLSEKIERQDFAVKVLKFHLEKNRLAHTYLFTGEKGAGKEDLALSFAKALNCEREQYFSGCDCASCHKIEKANHPDVHAVGADPKVRSIKIEEIRSALEAANFKPYEGKRKVFIIHDASRLTLEASNALLKMLEEPPAKTVFILMAESKEHLLGTIQSRSFEIRFKPVSENAEGQIIFGEIDSALQSKSWEELFDEYTASPRDEAKSYFDILMRYFRYKMEQTAGTALPWLEAIDRVIESKDALEANANQKLVLSRLAMQLRKTGMHA